MTTSEIINLLSRQFLLIIQYNFLILCSICLFLFKTWHFQFNLIWCLLGVHFSNHFSSVSKIWLTNILKIAKLMNKLMYQRMFTELAVYISDTYRVADDGDLEISFNVQSVGVIYNFRLPSVLPTKSQMWFSILILMR